MNIFWIFLLVPLCLDGIFSMVDNTSLTQQEQRKLGMQLNLMNGLAKKFEEQFSFTSSQKVYKDMNDIISKLNIYDAKAQMSLLKNIGGLIVSQNENIKNLVKFVNDLVPKMNVDKVDDQKSLLENLHNMVVSLSDDANVNNIKELLGKATNSYDELAQKTLNETRNSYLNSNSRNLPNSETIEELSNMITVHGSFDTNSDLVSVLRQLVESENEEDGSVQIQNDHENGPERNETLENAQKLYNKMAQNKLNEIKSRSFDEQQKLTLKDLDSLISKMENLQQTTQISLLETLSNLAQEENSRSIIYNRKFKQTSTSYNKSVEEKLGCLIKKYFISEGENKIYTPPDDMIFEHIESLISKINEPGVNDIILAILYQLNGIPPQDERTRDELIRKVETVHNGAAMAQLEVISKQYAENSENADDSVFQQLDRMIGDIKYFDETSKRKFVAVLHQLAYAVKENVKRSKQLIKKATTFIDEWITTHLNEIRVKYHQKQTAILPDDEIFHQLHIMISPHNELHISLEIVSVLESMVNLNDETRLLHEELLEKAETVYNEAAAAKLQELLEKRNSEPPHLVSSNDEIFGELESLISNVNDIKINEQILRILDSMKINEEDDAAETKHRKLTEKVISAMNTWTSDKVNEIEKNFNENKQSAPLLPNDPIFDELDMVITEVTEPRHRNRIFRIINQMEDSSGGNKDIIEKLNEMSGKNMTFFNMQVERQLNETIKKIKRQSIIPPNDRIFFVLKDLIGGIQIFSISNVELIFVALNSCVTRERRSTEQRDHLLQLAKTEYKNRVETHLKTFAAECEDQPKIGYLESINKLLTTDINDLEVYSIILRHLIQMECNEEEDGVRKTLILKVGDATHRRVQAQLWFVVSYYFDSDDDEATECADIKEVDELISHMDILYSKTQELIIETLLQTMDNRPSNRDEFIMKWYKACTFPELKKKYELIIQQHLEKSRYSPQEVSNPKDSESRDNHQ